MPDAGFEYTPRNAEATVLYRVVAEELETFLARQQERDHPAPRFVEECGAPHSSTKTWNRMIPLLLSAQEMFLIPAQRPDTTPLIPDGAERNQTRPPACAFAAMHAAGHAVCAVLQALADWHRRKSEVYAIIDVRIRDGSVWLEQGFPMRTRERLSGKSLLLWRKSEIPCGKSLFPWRNKQSPHGKSLFLIRS